MTERHEMNAEGTASASDAADSIEATEAKRCLEEARAPRRAEAAPPRSSTKLVPGTGDESAPAAATPPTPAETDSAAQAALVADELRGSARSIIRATARIAHALESFGPDEQRRFAFDLAKRRVLPANEAELGRSGPTLLKLVTIGEHADLFERPELAEYLPAGVTPLYHMALLYEALPKGPVERRMQELVRTLAPCEGKITREWLIGAKRRLGGGAEASKPSVTNKHQSEAPPEPPAGQTLAGLIEAGQLFNLLAIGIGDDDRRRLRGSYPLGYLASCLPLARAIERESAAVVTAARFSDLPLVLGKLLPLCNFDRPSRILLLRRPASPDVTGDDVLIIAERGNMRAGPIDWHPDGAPIDVAAVAGALYPNAARRLRVFTDTQTDGWTCLTSSRTWTEEPSVE